jgi:hypothetical protein
LAAAAGAASPRALILREPVPERPPAAPRERVAAAREPGEPQALAQAATAAPAALRAPLTAAAGSSVVRPAGTEAVRPG